MARHSKWHKVKQFKGALDQKRAASFTKLAREITVATREKGPDTSYNFRLRTAILRAREASMPKDSIERAIQRGTGGAGEGQIESLVYEGYGPGSAALIIECLTDNRNRTANDVKHLLCKHGGSLAAPGSVTYLFDRNGVLAASGQISEDAELKLIDAGAAEINRLDQETEVLCAPNDLQQVTDAAESLGLKVLSASIERAAKTEIAVTGANRSEVEELVEALEELDDVQQVTTNVGD